MRLWDFLMTLSETLLTIGTKLWEVLTTPVAQYLQSWDLSHIFGSGVIGNWLSEVVYNLIAFIFGENGTLLAAIPAFIAIILLIRFILLIFGK